MKKNWKRVILLFLTLVLSSALCLFMNRFNNKYAAPGAQPMDGLLVLSEKELEAHSAHYLINGWAFYPDVLLTPKDFEAGAGNEYMVYTSIGDRTRFDWLDAENPRGCGPYVLNLRLPDEPDTYALQLPEIYSAYRLYVNDRLAAQAGNPEAAHYQSRTQSRIVSFDAGGSVRLMLAVGNWTHFYSGLVYPPALGRADDVARLQSAQWALSACVVLAGLLGTFLSLWLGIRMKQGNARLFSLLCLTAALNAGAPMLHFFAELPVQPWYAIEIFMGYCTTMLILALQNRLCQVNEWSARISEIASLAFCLLALIYGLSASQLNVTHMRIFSVLAALFKIGTACWMLSASLLALLRRRMAVGQLFYGAVFYAAVLIWDRILPEFEPILGGWFSQWGTLALIMMIGYTLWRELVGAYSYSIAFAEEHRQLKRQLDMQFEHARQISDRFQEKQRMVHDFRHHIRSIHGMAEQIQSRDETQKYQEGLLAYLDALSQSEAPREETQPNALCNIPAVDALLQYYNHAAANRGIAAMLQLFIPENLPLNDMEWCAVLGNLLENAVEGCARSDAEHPDMHIVTKWTGKTFFLMVENTYDGKYSRRGNSFLSSKRKNQSMGVGLESVRDKIMRHGGSVNVYPMENSFRVGITLGGTEI